MRQYCGSGEDVDLGKIILGIPCIEGDMPCAIAERDIDSLARSIKEKLSVSCLKREKHKYSPYTKPSLRGHSCRPLPSSDANDPHQMLQELIDKGCLIQEAVKRLQLDASESDRKLYEYDEDAASPFAVY